MKKILFLVHRIPYPPNKGDKIRSFNLLKWLNKRYDVLLGCFVDEVDDMQYRAAVQEYCMDASFIFQNKTAQKIKSLAGLITGEALTLSYYRDTKMQQWVDQMLKQHQVDAVLVFSSSMAQYVSGQKYSKLKRIADFVDMDSDKWRQYAQNKTWPSSFIYSREHKYLGAYEKKIAKEFDNTFLITNDEADLFNKSVADTSIQDKVDFVENGVDSDYFDPAANMSSVQAKGPAVVFTGAMDYWANVDAVVWFAQKVWPIIIKENPKAHFYIVGGGPTQDVYALEKYQHIHVTGRVDDVRPYLKSASAVVAPLRIARGVQNKVLEAMSMAKPVVATSMAMEGISLEGGSSLHIYEEDDAGKYAQRVLDLLRNEVEIAGENRAFVKAKYGWDAKLGKLSQYLPAVDSNKQDGLQ